MFKRILLAAVVAVGVGSADATQIGRVGPEPCSAWTQARQAHTPVRLLMEQWITGWLDRANVSLDPDIDILGSVLWLGSTTIASRIHSTSSPTLLGLLSRN